MLPESGAVGSESLNPGFETPQAFRRAHPRYAGTAILDELRRSDFARLDAGGHVYLDYTGAGLYADSQLAEHVELLRANVLGNPHSLNPTSSAMTELVEQARAAVLEFFGASADEYVAIFTPNATGALRLVGETYPFHVGDRFLLTFDNHNSVNGIREFARARGAETTYVPSEAPDLRVDEELLPRYLTEVVGDHGDLLNEKGLAGTATPPVAWPRLGWLRRRNGPPSVEGCGCAARSRSESRRPRRRKRGIADQSGGAETACRSAAFPQQDQRRPSWRSAGAGPSLPYEDVVRRQVARAERPHLSWQARVRPEGPRSRRAQWRRGRHPAHDRL